MKLPKNLLISLSILALTAGPASAQIVLYSYDFSGSSTTNLNGQLVDTSGATAAQHLQYGTIEGHAWQAQADQLKADGSWSKPAGGTNGSTANLNFTPQQGYVYTLTSTTNMDLGGGWQAAGFIKTAGFTTGNFTSVNGGVFWSRTNPDSNNKTAHYARLSGGAGTSEAFGDLGSESPTTFTIELDTTNATYWVVNYSFNGGSALRTETFDPADTTIAAVGISTFNNANTSIPDGFTSFTLSVDAIETTSPRITSFSSLGGGIWEVTLADGGAATSYEFRSSTTLDFTPGNLVGGLSQENPGADPGDVDASGDFVTTDTNGDATVRMSLSGTRNFLRAVSLP
jgi:hypothetical protein